ncbi:serine/threonine protein kinase [Actinospica durhamensis]|uniref:Serine/threonine protein kinase n=1 Tax=Actinospica durhamensis TaxID=1508375 RepID=A0A941EYA8_9ACTN|nr:serine/threonine-protein kinase [Actinospica durhamensis]MBR7838597.1 serine/threonine protein kinase [Actinospica durhamensis]
MEKLVLTKVWELGDALDSDTGGFGRVFQANSPDGVPVVVKLIPKAPGAERELLFDGFGKRNVVPILDSGEHGQFWAIVMPRAEKSLRRHLEERGGSLPLDECVRVLLDIAQALADLDGQVVHRDLKPENVLLLDGAWRLADFGIARYAEAATAAQTWKLHGTSAYVAPERWRSDRATIASDVYSLGVIGFELFSGRTPFLGPEASDFARQHLHDPVPAMPHAPAQFAALINECLYRGAQARPTPANLCNRLEGIAQAPAIDGLAALAEANRAHVARVAESQRSESKQQTESERRQELFEAARASHRWIAQTLVVRLKGAASSGEDRVHADGGVTFSLGDANLYMTGASTAPQATNARFDVIARATVLLSFANGRHGYKGRSHSLWYCDAQSAGEYYWYETAFMHTPYPGFAMSSTLEDIDPFSLDPGTDAWAAINPGIARTQLAWPFNRIEPTAPDEFITRWGNWLAAAAAAQLTHPSSMPERSTDNCHR